MTCLLNHPTVIHWIVGRGGVLILSGGTKKFLEIMDLKGFMDISYFLIFQLKHSWFKCLNFWCTEKWLSYTYIFIYIFLFNIHYGLSPASSVAQMLKKICLQCRKPRFDPWVEKIPWGRKWQPTPVFLPGESQGRGGLVGCHLWGRTESDTTEAT